VSVDLLGCVATPAEGDRIGRYAAGGVAGTSIALVETGIGPVNAAYAAATRQARAIVVCGVGGAYPGSGLEVGDVACAESEYYADLGIEGACDMRVLGFEVAAGHYNRLPLDLFPAPRRVPFVTSSTCTATDERALELAERTGGAIESMEGAAVVHVALLRGLPVGEVRGVSNMAGKRNRAKWRLKEAARAAQETLLAWIEAGAC